MEKTSKPTIAGILIIIAGALAILGSLVLLILGFGGIGMMPGIPTELLSLLPVIFTTAGIVELIAAIIIIVGGVFALKRQIWGLALAGAILPIFFGGLLGLALGIASIVLLALSKNEFA